MTASTKDLIEAKLRSDVNVAVARVNDLSQLVDFLAVRPRRSNQAKADFAKAQERLRVAQVDLSIAQARRNEFRLTGVHYTGIGD